MSRDWPTCPRCFSRLRAEETRDWYYCDEPHGTLGKYEISGREAHEERDAKGGGAMTASVDGIASDLAWKAYGDGIAALDRRIDDDIALLIRAGVALSRISMETHPEVERRLCVDGRPVQRYTNLTHCPKHGTDEEKAANGELAAEPMP